MQVKNIVGATYFELVVVRRPLRKVCLSYNKHFIKLELLVFKKIIQTRLNADKSNFKEF